MKTPAEEMQDMFLAAINPEEEWDMDNYEDDWDEPDEEEEALAAQEAINAGHAWKMEGAVGRHLMRLIEAGHCMVGLEPRWDYFGNMIPARDMLEDGSKGTPGYVRTHMGQEWLDMLLAAEEERKEEE